jgi:hypothetical protein
MLASLSPQVFSRRSVLDLSRTASSHHRRQRGVWCIMGAAISRFWSFPYLSPDAWPWVHRFSFRQKDGETEYHYGQDLTPPQGGRSTIE